jgi:undecaprenyl-diphosphatase
MNLWRALILGLLQGLTEFLPVSSSGHLVLVPWILGWEDPGLTFDLVVHLGTLCAVVVYLWRDIVQLFTGLAYVVRTRRLDRPDARLLLLVALSAIPGAILGYLLEDWFEALFGTPWAVSLLLIVTGALLVVSERLGRRVRSVGQMSVKDALLIGLAQAVAIAPGISRSGATMSVGLLRGLRRDEAGRFAFLMAVPIIAGATAYALLKTIKAGVDASGTLVLAVGFIAAAASGYLAIRLLLNYVREHSLRPFAYYCWALAALGLILSVVL